MMWSMLCSQFAAKQAPVVIPATAYPQPEFRALLVKGEVEQVVSDIITEIRMRGDSALFDYTEKFDNLFDLMRSSCNSLGISNNVFSKLKAEAGVHRVQRVPQTETQGRVHTSAVTVAVMPQADEVDIAIRVNVGCGQMIRLFASIECEMRRVGPIAIAK